MPFRANKILFVFDKLKIVQDKNSFPLLSPNFLSIVIEYYSLGWEWISRPLVKSFYGAERRVICTFFFIGKFMPPPSIKNFTPRTPPPPAPAIAISSFFTQFAQHDNMTVKISSSHNLVCQLGFLSRLRSTWIFKNITYFQVQIEVFTWSCMGCFLKLAWIEVSKRFLNCIWYQLIVFFGFWNFDGAQGKRPLNLRLFCTKTQIPVFQNIKKHLLILLDLFSCFL